MNDVIMSRDEAEVFANKLHAAGIEIPRNMELIVNVPLPTIMNMLPSGMVCDQIMLTTSTGVKIRFVGLKPIR